MDYLGGYTVYGNIEKAGVARKEGLVPLGLTVGATLTRDVKQGQPLHYSEVELDESQTFIICAGFRIRRWVTSIRILKRVYMLNNSSGQHGKLLIW